MMIQVGNGSHAVKPAGSSGAYTETDFGLKSFRSDSQRPVWRHTDLSHHMDLTGSWKLTGTHGHDDIEDET